jgi:8-oxo-dGTP pyrophosphatase MutT (NUDIX family)
MSLARQIGALPIRRSADGSVSVLLITSRETRRWIIPKGWPKHGRADHVTAAEEALEEAGVVGLAHPHRLGTYAYEKRQTTGDIQVRVSVYLLEVQEELALWPECDQRERAWYPLAEALTKVEEPELRRFLRTLKL